MGRRQNRSADDITALKTRGAWAAIGILISSTSFTTPQTGGAPDGIYPGQRHRPQSVARTVARRHNLFYKVIQRPASGRLRTDAFQLVTLPRHQPRTHPAAPPRAATSGSGGEFKFDGPPDQVETVGSTVALDRIGAHEPHLGFR